MNNFQQVCYHENSLKPGLCLIIYYCKSLPASLEHVTPNIGEIFLVTGEITFLRL